MRVVIDATPVRYGGFAVALEGLLNGWRTVPGEDELHLVLADGARLKVPDFVKIHRVRIRRPAALSQPLAQSLALRRICRCVDAEVLLATLPITAAIAVGCPKVITVYDLRHELLPEQFSSPRRWLRKLSYGIGYRQAAAIICISDRTRKDLLTLHPELKSKPVEVVLWGAEHTDSWPQRDPDGEPYALAFGHFVNKGVARVIDAWKLLKQRGEARPLVFVGLPPGQREMIQAQIDNAGLSDLIKPLEWLEPHDFHERFASAAVIVFPSDFEGFGLPAVEALRLKIPLVISPDEALLEVTGGHAEVMEGWDVPALADAVSRAWTRSERDLERAREWVEAFTWTTMAAETRSVLAEVVAQHG